KQKAAAVGIFHNGGAEVACGFEPCAEESLVNRPRLEAEDSERKPRRRVERADRQEFAFRRAEMSETPRLDRPLDGAHLLALNPRIARSDLFFPPRADDHRSHFCHFQAETTP